MSDLDGIDAIFEINAGGTTWGSIIGDIEDQADLKEALDSITGDVGDLDSIVSANYEELNDKISDNSTDIANHIADTNNPHVVTKAQVGLGNADNTSDLNKPISTATQTALNGKVPTSRKINNKPLTGDIELTAADIGALSSSTTINNLTTAAQQAALNSGVTSSNYVTTNTPQSISGVKIFTGMNNMFQQQLLMNGTSLIRYTNGVVHSILIGKETSSEPGSGYVRLGNKSDTTIIFGRGARPTYAPYAIGYTSDTNISNAVDLALYSDVTGEATARETADSSLQSQIDAITSASDVTDIVGTYAALQAYDTTHLPNNSIIEVLKDESQNNQTPYYRWIITGGDGDWVLIGAEGPYYTIAAADSTFVPKTRTINGKPLSNNITLTASDVGALSTITSSDVTTALGYTPVNKAGDTMSNLVISRNNPLFSVKDTSLTFGTNPDANKYTTMTRILDSNNTVVSDVVYNTNTDGSHRLYLQARKSVTEPNVYATLTIGFDADGNAYSTTVNPPANSNNTSIATTSWVRGYGADKTLSNVTSIDSNSAVYTALAAKQDTLISGTNIKTLNGSDILGSGNIAVANTTLSNIDNIDANSAVQTALDYKVNISGDTMTGTLHMSKLGKGVISLDGITTSGYSDIQFVQNDNKRIGFVRGNNYSSTNRKVSLSVCDDNDNSAGSIELIYNNGVNSCLFPNTTCVDGQWVSKYSTLASSQNLPTTDNDVYTLYDINSSSNYLPDDCVNYNYEILVDGLIYGSQTSGQASILTVQGKVTKRLATLISRGSSLRQGTTVSIPVGYTSADGKAYLNVVKDASNYGTYNLALRGYRRIGTNQ